MSPSPSNLSNDQLVEAFKQAKSGSRDHRRLLAEIRARSVRAVDHHIAELAKPR